MRNLRIAIALVIIFAGITLIGGLLHWTINRIYVPEGKSMVLRYKGPLLFGSRHYAKSGQYAEPGEIGILRDVRGPGRHFFCPIWWERRVVNDVVVSPGEVAIFTSKMGETLPAGQFLVDGDLGETTQKGILRKVFAPGRYRYNTYGYDVEIVTLKSERMGDQEKMSGWVNIPTGYVGVVTLLTDDLRTNRKAGIQNDVLAPGIYPVNPRELQIDIVEVGFRETSISVDKQMDARGNPVTDVSGEPVAVKNSGIGFPSSDGFPIQLDFTLIWGIMPEQAPNLVRTFGGMAAAEQKVILPQSESICRNAGSTMGAVELLIGETRKSFQSEVSREVQEVLEEKDIQLLYGLVRHIYIPQDVRVPIQKGFVADELTLTREQEKLTAKTEANLREAEKKVDLEKEKVRTETAKLVASVLAEGESKAREIAAESRQLVAEVDLKIAELDAKKEVTLGEAEGTAEQMQQEARAQKFQLAVDAFGDPAAYNRWQFAESLPETIDLRLFYAGEGTLWTDLKSVLPTLPIGPSTGSEKAGLGKSGTSKTSSAKARSPRPGNERSGTDQRPSEKGTGDSDQASEDTNR